MTTTILITGSDYAGKTSISLGLGLLLKQEGKDVAYFKPIGQPTREAHDNVIDEDVVVMKNVLGLDFDTSTISPIHLKHNYVTQLLNENPSKFQKKVQSAFAKISQKADIVLVEASNLPETLTHFGLASSDIALMTKAKVLLITKGYSEGVLDYNLMQKKYLEDQGCMVLGGIINHVPPLFMKSITETICPILEKRQMKCFGVIPKKESMGSPEVHELVRILNAAVLTGQEFLGRSVDNLFVGAMTPDSALKFFRQSINHAVITGGDRADIAMAALETKTAALIFTGGMRPSEIVIAAANERGVPVLEVMDDTYTAVKKIERLMGRIRPTDTQHIALATEAVKNHVRYHELFE